MNTVSNEPKFVEEARLLIAQARHGALATLRSETEMPHPPFVSLVNLSPQGDQIFLLLSRLAVHTQNLDQFAAASLLIENNTSLTSDESVDPLAAARLTLSGTLEPSHHKDDPEWCARYVKHHPASMTYIQFADFFAYQFTIDEVHLVAGFGRIETFSGELLRRA